jgi:hypothetical protein
MWDARKQLRRIPEETKRNWVRGARRATQLMHHNLLYTYTLISGNQMRLLIVKPVKKHTEDLVILVCTYLDEEVGPRAEHQPYEALSYHWGAGPATKPVFVKPIDKLDGHFRSENLRSRTSFYDLMLLQSWVADWDKSHRFYVRDNLDKALRHLRHKTEVIVLWVDALCINQSYTKVEKPAQIAKMTTIYSKASNVCVWLGDGKSEHEDRTQDFYQAVQFSQEIIELQHLERLIQDRHSEHLHRCS